ncbi:sulfotransferase 4A1-like [Mercenaria mercenaria]|uniref:sulfotransferase 4A1-like n=1 Tax=Mercenaria mercenaria TaxID=6596 RepID=UPI00234F2E01|nr:sulfotransferase 4A1-like [Mercenaria mercenaria]
MTVVKYLLNCRTRSTKICIREVLWHGKSLPIRQEVEMDAAAEKPRLQLIRKVYKGVVMFENEVEEIEKMETREDDIWVCSFPRSGTTLTQELVILIETRDYEKATTMQLDEVFPIIDVKDDRFPYYKGIKYVEQMKSPRLIKCHLHYHMLPEQLRQGKGRIIYIARNPKDLVTSFYRLMQWGDQLEEGDKTFHQFIDAFINGTGFSCPWSKHLLEFWEKRNDEHVLFLKYEEVVKDMAKAVRQISE